MPGEFAQNYEQLASAELQAASIAGDQVGKKYHLNKAAIFAYLGDDHKTTKARLIDRNGVIETLKSLLVIVDSLGEVVAGIHVNEALVALDGMGVCPA